MLDVAVVWLSRDLRLHDNPALSAALVAARRLVRHRLFKVCAESKCAVPDEDGG